MHPDIFIPTYHRQLKRQKQQKTITKYLKNKKYVLVYTSFTFSSIFLLFFLSIPTLSRRFFSLPNFHLAFFFYLHFVPISYSIYITDSSRRLEKEMERRGEEGGAGWSSGGRIATVSRRLTSRVRRGHDGVLPVDAVVVGELEQVRGVLRQALRQRIQLLREDLQLASVPDELLGGMDDPVARDPEAGLAEADVVSFDVDSVGVLRRMGGASLGVGVGRRSGDDVDLQGVAEIVEVARHRIHMRECAAVVARFLSADALRGLGPGGEEDDGVGTTGGGRRGGRSRRTSGGALAFAFVGGAGGQTRGGRSVLRERDGVDEGGFGGGGRCGVVVVGLVVDNDAVLAVVFDDFFLDGVVVVGGGEFRNGGDGGLARKGLAFALRREGAALLAEVAALAGLAVGVGVDEDETLLLLLAIRAMGGSGLEEFGGCGHRLGPRFLVPLGASTGRRSIVEIVGVVSSITVVGSVGVVGSVVSDWSGATRGGGGWRTRSGNENLRNEARGTRRHTWAARTSGRAACRGWSGRDGGGSGGAGQSGSLRSRRGGCQGGQSRRSDETASGDERILRTTTETNRRTKANVGKGGVGTSDTSSGSSVTAECLDESQCSGEDQRSLARTNSIDKSS